MILVGFAEDGQSVEVDLVSLKGLEASHDFLETWLPTTVDPIEIVDVLGPIDGDAYQELVFAEELAPLVIHQDSVGLEGVRDFFLSPVFLLKLDNFSKVVDTQDGGLSALPGEQDFRSAMSLDVLAHKRLQNVVGHGPIGVGRVELFFLEIETVLAVQVTNGPGGLGHNMECRQGRHLSAFRKQTKQTCHYVKIYRFRLKKSPCEGITLSHQNGGAGGMV